MKPSIIPAVLAPSEKEAREKFAALDDAATWIQLDVMDGRFVKNATWHDAKAFKRWGVKAHLELHLMANEPKAMIEEWRGVKNLRRVIWHVEAPVAHERLITFAKRRRLEVGLAINPDTPVAALVPYLRHLDTVLVMGVAPGWSGQKLQAKSLRKIAELKRLAPRLPLGFDGGVNARNMVSLARRGLWHVNMASAIFRAKDPALRLRELQKRLKRV